MHEGAQKIIGDYEDRSGCPRHGWRSGSGTLLQKRDFDIEEYIGDFSFHGESETRKKLLFRYLTERVRAYRSWLAVAGGFLENNPLLVHMLDMQDEAVRKPDPSSKITYKKIYAQLEIGGCSLRFYINPDTGLISRYKVIYNYKDEEDFKRADQIDPLRRQIVAGRYFGSWYFKDEHIGGLFEIPKFFREKLVRNNIQIPTVRFPGRYQISAYELLINDFSGSAFRMFILQRPSGLIIRDKTEYPLNPKLLNEQGTLNIRRGLPNERVVCLTQDRLEVYNCDDTISLPKAIDHIEQEQINPQDCMEAFLGVVANNCHKIMDEIQIY